jgi:hypothetical protein
MEGWEGMTDLAQLSQYLGCGEFKPMRDVPGAWDTFAGANPGTYITYHDETARTLFAEPSGDVGILKAGSEDDEEINFNVGELTGFSDDAVNANKKYHDEVKQLRSVQ